MDVEDEEGLKRAYDVVLLGTGMVQSLLSCALAKSGKSVLHLDFNDQYGENFSSSSLRALINQNNAASAGVPADDGISAADVEDHITLIRNVQIASKAPHVDMDSLAKVTSVPFRSERRMHPACFGCVMERETTTNSTMNTSTTIHPSFFGYNTCKDMTLAKALNQDRDFNLDNTCHLLHASGSFIESVIASGVHNYLEFKSVTGLYVWTPPATTSGNSSSSTHKSGSGFWKAPCSKMDVFNTNKLDTSEKRSLMKFHHFISDWGREHAGTEVYCLNEIELMSGRSLYRPQNKKNALTGFDAASFLDKPFEQFLDHCKLSKKLQSLVLYVLCFRASAAAVGIGAVGPESGSTGDGSLTATVGQYKTVDALHDLFLHINSLGRYGETAFLLPMYGSAEISQAFCRMSSVWGGVFILRRGVKNLRFHTPDDTAVTNTPATATAAAAAVVSAVDAIAPLEASTELVGHDSSSPTADDSSSAPVNERSITCVQDSTGKIFRCKAFICSDRFWPRRLQCLPSSTADNSPAVTTTSTHRAVVTCTVVCNGTCPLIAYERSVAIIPPFSHYRRRSTEHGSASSIMGGESVLISTSASTIISQQEEVRALNNKSSIRIIQTDDGVNACPANMTVLNITTTVECAVCADGGVDIEVLFNERVGAEADMLLARLFDMLTYGISDDKSGSSSNDSSFGILYHSSTITPLYEIDQSTLPRNVGVSIESSESVFLEHSIEQAKTIFERLFPDEKFTFDDKEEDKRAADKEGEEDATTGNDVKKESGTGANGTDASENFAEDVASTAVAAAAPASSSGGGGYDDEEDDELAYLMATLEAVQKSDQAAASAAATAALDASLDAAASSAAVSNDLATTVIDTSDVTEETVPEP